MSNGVIKSLNIPAGVATTRYKAPKPIEFPVGEDGRTDLPFLDKNDPAHKQLQERLIAHVKVFDLSDPAHLAEYAKVWQSISDQASVVCETKVEYVESKGTFLALLRWGEIVVLPPTGSR